MSWNWTYPDRVAVVDQDVGGHRDALGVEPPGVGAGAGGRDDLGERLPVVAVPVRGDDGRDAVVTDRAEQGVRVVGGVDQQLLVGGPAAQQIGVVVHRADRDLGDHQVLELVHVGGSADRHLSAVRHDEPPSGVRPSGDRVPPAYRGGSTGSGPPSTLSAEPSRRPASQPSRSAGGPATVTAVSASRPVRHARVPSVSLVGGTSG
ncbi:hypothetical protein SALBM311S_11119 [Streptomyces alboniger]